MSLACDKIPMIQVRSRSLILYEQYIRSGRRKSGGNINHFNTNVGIVEGVNNSTRISPYSGKMTTHAKRRLAKAVSLLNQSSRWRKVYNGVVGKKVDFKLAFVTLTIPCENIIGGKDGYKMLLKPFMRILKRDYPGLLYVWKAELQDRGQLHYHITINELIEHYKVRNLWNKILSKSGLMTDFVNKKGHANAPSTEIRAVNNVANIEAYLVKYISKEDSQGRSIGGRVWGCSEELAKHGYFSDIFCEANEKAIDMAVKAKKAIFKVCDRCTIVEFVKGSVWSVLSQYQSSLYQQFLLAISRPILV